jgi:hypothetical protein
MQRLMLGLIGASLLAGATPAIAQPYGDNHDNDWRYHQRYDRDQNDSRWRHHHDRYRYSYNYNTVRRCAWRFGERVCWIERD